MRSAPTPGSPSSLAAPAWSVCGNPENEKPRIPWCGWRTHSTDSNPHLELLTRLGIPGVGSRPTPGMENPSWLVSRWSAGYNAGTGCERGEAEDEMAVNTEQAEYLYQPQVAWCRALVDEVLSPWRRRV